jgi:hypothetical protein
MHELVGSISTLQEGFRDLLGFGVHRIRYQNVPKDTIHVNMRVRREDLTYIMNLFAFYEFCDVSSDQLTNALLI